MNVSCKAQLICEINTVQKLLETAVNLEYQDRTSWILTTFKNAPKSYSHFHIWIRLCFFDMAMV